MSFSNHNNNQSVNIGPCGTATLSNLAASATNVTLLEAKAKRVGVIVYNDSSSAMYIKYGSTASTTSFTYKILGTQTWEMPDPVYTGAIDCLWDSATGSARITEST